MRYYSVSMETSSISAAKTLLYLTTPNDMVVQIVSVEVVAPDDDTNEQMHCTLQRITTLGTPTATAQTAAPHASGDAAATVTIAGDVTASEPTYTANTEIGEAGAPSLTGYRQEWPDPHARPTVPPSSNIGLRLLTAPGTAKTLTVRMTFCEVD